MLAKVDELCAERDRLVGQCHIAKRVQSRRAREASLLGLAQKYSRLRRAKPELTRLHFTI